MSKALAERFILRVSCRDNVGIVADVATLLAGRELFIIETANYGDPNTGLFFMRTVFTPQTTFTTTEFRKAFETIASRWDMTWELRDAHAKPNVLILASKQDHCLNDLLYRHRINSLSMNIAAIVSNHSTCGWLAERDGIPFYHIPVDRDGKEAAETRLLELVDSMKIDLVVLARYMQVLSDKACLALGGRCINIHHSFLPGFKGAAPYTQAFNRGVKLIGATAHYVTADLDEGPIIAQAVERSTHAHSPEEMAAIGRDIESRVLASAVKLHLEGRIFLNASKTIVLD